MAESECTTVVTKSDDFEADVLKTGPEGDQNTDETPLDKPKDVRKNRPGFANIKNEFIINDYKPSLDTEFLPAAVKEDLENLEKQKLESQANKNSDSNAEPPVKKVKLKGRNKGRPVEKHPVGMNKLCPMVIAETECPYGDSCKFTHDISDYMSKKEPDLGPRCLIYEKFGKCVYGVACRFGQQHLDSEYKNIVNTQLWSEMKGRYNAVNTLTKDLQITLRKKKYDFSKTGRNVDEIIKMCQRRDNAKRVQSKLATGEPKTMTTTNNIVQSQNDAVTSEDKTVHASTGSALDKIAQLAVKSDDISLKKEAVSEEAAKQVNIDSNIISVKSDLQTKCGQNAVSDSIQNETVYPSSHETIHQAHETNVESKIRLRPQEKKKVIFENKLYLAPLTTVGNLPFRRVCKKYGADITCGEMALSTVILKGHQSEWALLKRHESEDVFGVQVCGAYPDSMTRCAELINDNLQVDFVDINCGCPIDLVFNKGEGSALMGRTNKLEQIVLSMNSVLDVPLTVKMRTGIYEDKSNAHLLVPKLESWGASMAAIHGRSRQQRYTRSANWNYIKKCAAESKTMPVFGCGDVLSFEDYNSFQEQSGVAGIMIARGGLIKPWLFTEIKEQRHWDISSSERLEMMRDFTNHGLLHWGSDTQGIETTRRFLLEWLSFLYRYIPVGVLESVPQKIGERPPRYFGRNDLETLFSSPSCGDWVKISEMLLGPVPAGFTFLPKHKANSYK